jgi:hypothetical protein
MTGFSRRPIGTAESPAVSAAELLRRRPSRITLTVHWQLRQELQKRADEQGRSLSNLLAFLLEQACTAPEEPKT